MLRSQLLLGDKSCMKVIRDCFGRMAHILQHPEIAGMEAAIAQALQSPLEIRISRSDKTVQLFYEYHARTRVGGKWLCIAVKYPTADGFIVTPYLTDRVKEGETIWPTK